MQETVCFFGASSRHFAISLSSTLTGRWCPILFQAQRSRVRRPIKVLSFKENGGVKCHFAHPMFQPARRQRMSNCKDLMQHPNARRCVLMNGSGMILRRVRRANDQSDCVNPSPMTTCCYFCVGRDGGPVEEDIHGGPERPLRQDLRSENARDWLGVRLRALN